MSSEIKQIEKIEQSIQAPWVRSGESPEDYIIRVTESLKGVSDLLDARTTDTSMVQSAIKDTAELVIYATARKELTALKSLVLSHTAREKRHGSNNSKGFDAGR